MTIDVFLEELIDNKDTKKRKMNFLNSVSGKYSCSRDQDRKLTNCITNKMNKELNNLKAASDFNTYSLQIVSLKI